MSKTDSIISNGMDYRQANLFRKELALAETRGEIMAMEPSKALDAILGSRSPATLVQSFSDQDLYFMMHQVGVDDFLPVLSMASSEQWEYFLDVDVWRGDRIDPEEMTRTLDILFRADPERLMRWLVSEKPDFLENWLFSNMEIRVREHDEDPSSFPDGFQTIDDIFYFRFPDRASTSEEAGDDLDGEGNARQEMAGDLIEKMIDTVAGMDLSVLHGMLLETCSVIPAEIEEEQYRLRNVRLAEKGFLPFHEAVGIYQPVRPGAVRKRPESYRVRTVFGTELPMPPVFPREMLKNDSLFAASLSMIDNEALLLNLQAEFASLINRLVSTEKTVLRDRADLETIIRKGCSYLSLGIEAIHGRDRVCLPGHGATIVGDVLLEDIFRVASGIVLEMKKQAVDWHRSSWIEENSLPLSFLGEYWLGTLGGLLLNRPLFFDNYETGVMYRPFGSLEDVSRASENLVLIMEVDQVIRHLDADITTFSHGILTWKSLVLTLWARDRLGMAAVLEPIEADRFKDFVGELFSGDGDKRSIQPDRRDDLRSWLTRDTDLDKASLSRGFDRVVDSLFDELEDELGSVSLANLEPGLITHFLVKA